MVDLLSRSTLPMQLAVLCWLTACGVAPSGPPADEGTARSAASRSQWYHGRAHPVVGANFNKRPDRMDLLQVQGAGVRWVRGSIDMLPFIHKEGADIGPNVTKLTQAQALKLATILTLRWDFGTGARFMTSPSIPPVNSKRERLYFDKALEVVDRAGLNAKIIVVGNEPTLAETQPGDWDERQTGTIPMVIFYRRLAEEVHNHLEDRRRRIGKLLLVGAFNRLQQPKTQSDPAVLRLLRTARENTFIDGIDLHLHVRNMTDFADALAFARRKCPDKFIIVTEYSIVWAFRQHFLTPVCQGASERAYCDSYASSLGITPRSTVLDFINRALSQPVTREAWSQFYKTRSWLPADFLQEAYDLFVSHRVLVATYGFAQVDRGASLTVDDVPWLMNHIYVGVTVQRHADGTAKTNHYFSRTFTALPKD